MPLLPFLMIPLGLVFRQTPALVIIELGALSILIDWSGV